MTTLSPPAPSTYPPMPQRTRAKRRHTGATWMQIAVARLSVLNVCGVVLLWVLIFVVSERWWVGTVLTYLPRWPWVVPSLILSLAGLLFYRRAAVLNVAAAAVVLGPISQYELPPSEPAAAANAVSLTVVSCNVQGYQQDYERLLLGIERLDVDVVAFQEAVPNQEFVKEHFRDWHVVHRGEFLIAAKFPLRFVEECWSEAFDRRTAICVSAETPAGEVMIVNVHQMTARRALNELKSQGVLDGEGPAHVERQALSREAEAHDTHDFVDHFVTGKPSLIVGDFNMPTSSNIYRDYWSSFKNAFDAAGTGYGYTSPCSRFWWWPFETPWLRIDHILTTRDWVATTCRTGDSGGSDHKLVWARLHAARRNDE